ncbi:MAG: DUF1223 domain-containing protein [Rubrivivax sp.]
MHKPPVRLLIVFGLAWPSWGLTADAAPRCAVESTARVPLLVELYTSEGCESCPPADRWLSELKSRPELMALSFHVDYWDRLGWKDRFASAAHSQRQAQLLRSNGARYVYTPQVLVDGLDQPAWRSLELPQSAARPAAVVQATLAREGTRYVAEVRVQDGVERRIGGYWALTEDGHVSVVKSGENRGATLAHDFVVREYQPIADWSARPQAPVTLQFRPREPIDPAHPRQLSLVLVDAHSARTLQVLRLGC